MNKQRRKELDKIQDEIMDLQTALEELKDAEQEAFDNLPESLQYSERGEAMQSAIENLEYAHDSLQDAIDNISEVIEQ